MILLTTPILHESPKYYISYTWGRRYMVSTITSTQVYKQISPNARKNIYLFTNLFKNTYATSFFYRLRNYGDLEATVEELSAIYDKKTLIHIYHEAVSEDYSFLYVSLMSKDKRKMLMTRFNLYFYYLCNDNSYYQSR